MNFVPQSILISSGRPLRQMNLLNALIMESVFKVFAISMCMARTVKHVKMHPYLKFEEVEKLLRNPQYHMCLIFESETQPFCFRYSRLLIIPQIFQTSRRVNIQLGNVARFSTNKHYTFNEGNCHTHGFEFKVSISQRFE